MSTEALYRNGVEATEATAARDVPSQAQTADAPPGAGAPPQLVPAMRKATRRQHHIANALILAKLAVALTDRRLYAKALGQFLPVYSELEAVLSKHRDKPLLGEVAGIVLDIPSRSEAMRRDLQYLLGPGWGEEVPPSSSAEAYAAHVRDVAARDPVLLIPYAWSLNVPILLPFMGRRISQGLGLESDGPGTEFFQASDKEARLSQLRAAVNRAGAALSEAQWSGCLEEAVEQFRGNNAVVAEFQLPLGSAAAAVVRAVLAARVELRAAFLAAVMVAALAALLARRQASSSS